MASPNFDSLSVELSHKIDDPVTTATSDGYTITSYQRSVFLNNAIRRLLVKWTQAGRWDALRLYIKEESQALTNNIVPLSAFTGGVFIIRSVWNTTKNRSIRPLAVEMKSVIVTGENSYVTPSANQQYYEINNGNLLLIDGATTTSDTITLNYIKQHSNLSVGAGESTVIFDAAFTINSTTVTNFANVISTHVGGKLVGTDAGGNYFERVITGYLSSTSFTINSAVVSAGSCTNGYILPPSQNDIEIESQYWDEIIYEAQREYAMWYKTKENITRE